MTIPRVPTFRRIALGIALVCAVLAGSLVAAAPANAVAPAGLSGTVTNAQGAPMASTEYYVENTDRLYAGFTDASGVYWIPDIIAGSYRICILPGTATNSVQTCSGGVWTEDKELATMVAVSGSQPTVYNMTLADGAVITGTIRDANGAAVTDAKVYLFAAGRPAQLQYGIYRIAATVTSDGSYTIRQVPINRAVIVAGSAGTGLSGQQPKDYQNGYFSDYYSAAATYASATTITATAQAQSIPNVNLVLTKPFFADVTDRSSTFFTPITWMATEAISLGTPQPSGLPLYKPSDSVSRQAMAQFLYRLAGEPAVTLPATPTFADVAAGNQFYTAVEWMAQAGISAGTPQSTGKPLFKPLDAVSRQAMALFLSRYAQVSPSTADIQRFADVPSSAASATAAAINWMYDTGISTGTPQSSGLPLYSPLSAVSRQAMAAFLYRLDHLPS